uniref:Putative secreted protein n=1 Tax=Ixodes ricinus TaxID=34613 RepID=A0A6B0URI6_IXORI
MLLTLMWLVRLPHPLSARNFLPLSWTVKTHSARFSTYVLQFCIQCFLAPLESFHLIFLMHAAYPFCVIFTARNKSGKCLPLRHFCSTFTGNEGVKGCRTALDVILRTMTTALSPPRDNPRKFLLSHSQK